MINLGQLSNYITINDNTQTLLNVAMARINDVLGYDLEYQLRTEKIQSNKVNPIYISYRPLGKGFRTVSFQKVVKHIGFR